MRARGGRRREYQPVCSSLSASSHPRDVAASLAALGCRQFYLADLDAIEGGPPQWDGIEQAARSCETLHLDGGWRSAERLAQLTDFARERELNIQPVIGLESLEDLSELRAMIAAAGGVSVSFSLDLRDGQPITRIAAWRNLSVWEIAEQVANAGFHRWIVLDLAHVGSGSGAPTASLCRGLVQRYPQLPVWTGGGVSACEDLDELASAGCQAVLIASAIHDGKITAADVLRCSQSL